MFFVILANDRPGALAARLAHRQRHIDYWNGLQGVVRIGGAMLSGDDAAATPRGSAFIIEAASLDEARAMLAGDPFSIEGIFDGEARIEVLRPGIGSWKPD